MPSSMFFIIFISKAIPHSVWLWIFGAIILFYLFVLIKRYYEKNIDSEEPLTSQQITSIAYHLACAMAMFYATYSGNHHHAHQSEIKLNSADSSMPLFAWPLIFVFF